MAGVMEILTPSHDQVVLRCASCRADLYTGPRDGIGDVIRAVAHNHECSPKPAA